MIYNRKTKAYYEPKESKFLVFFYKTIIGRFILKIFTMMWFSKLVAFYMNSSLSKRRIKRFIRHNNINMDEYIKTEYQCFDSFFTRNIDLVNRPLVKDQNILVSPCDAKLSVYTIDDHTNLKIKNSYYTIQELLQDSTLSQRYSGGYCLVFRLCVDDYHHYYYIDNGENVFSKHIDGKLHTVRPIAHAYTKVFSENTREFSLIKTENFGEIIQMEVGALLIGKIVNKDIKVFKRGDERGYFQFGGSTIVLLLEKGYVDLDSDIVNKLDSDIEVQVKLFEKIGRRKRNV